MQDRCTLAGGVKCVSDSITFAIMVMLWNK